MKLRVTNHDRDSAHRMYVYPVLSRRAGGVSLGINLNPNNACNFRCVYCQVPGLHYGKAPPLDLEQLSSELHSMLEEILHGDFLQARVETEQRALKDIAFSGNGEPTSSPQFLESVEIVRAALEGFQLRGKVPVVLITNGTLTDRPRVAEAIAQLASLNGEVWFKLDSATQAGAQRINDSSASLEHRVERLRQVARRCPTWIQTCLFAWDGNPPSTVEQDAYLDLVRDLLGERVPLRGVLLYGIARPSMQPEAERLSPLPGEWLTEFGARIEALGLPVRVTA